MAVDLYPKFKAIHPIYRFDDRSLRLGDVPGIAVDVEDEIGFVSELTKMLDGSRSVEVIHNELLLKYRELDLEDVQEAIDELNTLGFIENESFGTQNSLTDRQRERYKANVRYFSFFTDAHYSPYAVQEKLLQTRVTVLGMGAFGSSILVNLTGLGFGHIRILDFDTVELSNLNRQFMFKEGDIGRKKIEVAQTFVNEFNSDLAIETLSVQLRSVDEIRTAIQGSDLVLLAADQPFVILQRMVNQACVELGIPLIGGGINLTEGMVYTIIPG
ncbi:ThiF family adenylyltransferase [Brevibacillus humidisoli]|uniref:HesA/MoeB/ThiF family protein n=1 Tax=Brevibacillus humidisoli TaxID=2895522 RepID=UPI001E4BDB75|nr:ThiF family adenylyltransferase [Brevibacillus humidisoli]UFJ42860.1 ThiF family adenylyltransferase [Brevibacillus humidisoli]